MQAVSGSKKADPSLCGRKSKTAAAPFRMTNVLAWGHTNQETALVLQIPLNAAFATLRKKSGEHCPPLFVIKSAHFAAAGFCCGNGTGAYFARTEVKGAASLGTGISPVRTLRKGTTLP